jgi:hypothetical protein
LELRLNVSRTLFLGDIGALETPVPAAAFTVTFVGATPFAAAAADTAAAAASRVRTTARPSL